MAEEHLTDGTTALAAQPRVIKIEVSEKPQNVRLRVAAYTRVSSDSDDQLNSFAAQNRYYTELISSKPEWRMVDLYADEGITGTSAEKRKDFQRMMADCRRGLIDQILVKSISRFARNTRDCLQSIRELKTLGVNVRFEREGIDTANVSSELITAIYAAFAQKESESISGNMRWSYQRRMESGKFVPTTMPFGYVRVHNTIMIEPEEAVVVYQIFYRYINGENTKEIAQWLNRQRETCSAAAHREWTFRAVARILNNEKYTGDSLWQKSYSTNSFPSKRRPNRGEREQYFAENTHPAIIEKWVYQKARQLLKTRAAWTGQESVENIFYGKIVCGNCGARLRYRRWNGRDYYSCRNHANAKDTCGVTPILESELRNAFCRLHYKLKHQGISILGEMLTNFQIIRSRRMLWSADIVSLNKKISDLSNQNQTLTFLKQQGLVDPDIFISKTNELIKQLRQAKQEKERLMDAENDLAEMQTQHLIDTLEDGPDFLESFDTELFHELVDKIIIENNDSIRFCLKNGMELREAIERTTRS